MPGTEERVVSKGELRAGFETECRDTYCNSAFCPALLCTWSAIGTLCFLTYRFLYIETIVRDTTELCYDQIPNCEVFNATYLGVVGDCRDKWEYRYQLPGFSNIFTSTIQVQRAGNDCTTPDPGSNTVSLGFRTCFLRNSLCPPELVFCSTGGPPCASLLGQTHTAEDPDLRVLYGILFFGIGLFAVPIAVVTLYTFMRDTWMVYRLYSCGYFMQRYKERQEVALGQEGAKT